MTGRARPDRRSRRGFGKRNTMNRPRRRFLYLAAAAASFPALSRNAVAQAFPTRPVTMIVENISGAAGSIGVGRVARAAPDGYTLVLGNLGTHVFNGAIYSLAYDLVNDFEAVALLPANNQLFIYTKR